MIKVAAVLGLWLLFLASCSSSENGGRRPLVRDRSITRANAITQLFLDSGRVEAFIAKEGLNDTAAQQIRDFYNGRNYEYAWFTEEGPAEHTRSFWHLLNQQLHLSGDTAADEQSLPRQMAQYTDADTSFNPGSERVAQTELELTAHFFRYARQTYAGQVDPVELQWYIPRKKIDAMALLDSLIAGKGRSLADWEPVNNLYKRMDGELKRYYALQKRGGWDPIPLSGKKKWTEGAADPGIRMVKDRLRLTGDLANTADTSAVYTPELRAAVDRAHLRFGQKPDGIIDEALIKELNVPVKDRIEQMLVNMERMRWLPKDPPGNRIIANIPEFRLHVFDHSKPAFEMDIVVGNVANKSVVFSDTLKHIVFSPYWNVPASIVRKEIQPAMERNPAYLAEHNMEQTGTRGGLPVIRQLPGGENSLGRVKFLFPNSFNIYFHDTPAKSLFDREKRAFSHGCIRLAEPRRLAEFLLRDQPEWTPEKIDAAMNADTEKWVNLKDPVPVSIIYLTSWVDRSGLLHFRPDIYGLDRKMADRMFGTGPKS